MHEWAKTVQELVAGKTFEEYETSKMLRLAVERAIEIIGEATRCVSDDLRAQNPEIPWKIIEGQRHVLAHDYGEIKNDKIWRVATTHVPALIAMLEPILRANPPANPPPP
jgi:uncharacterized protein with HEPN domain